MSEDANGRPRPRADYQAALDCISNEIVRNPMAMAQNGEPLLIHYIVLRELLQERLATLPEDVPEPR